MISIPIIYENSDILIINKPAGLAVQGGQNVTHSLDKDLSEQLGYKIYLVHRLDKDTNGLMIVAKSPFAASIWTNLIGSKKVKKEYIAICAGTLNQKKGIIKENIVQHGIEKNAVTEYEVEETFTRSGTEHEYTFSKIRLKLETGRMHQIRIHLAKQNCPIAADDQHGNFKLNKALKKELKIKQLLLCSQRLSVPIDGKIETFSIELPDFMLLTENLIDVKI